MTKRDMNQQKPKVQPVNKLMRNIKEIKMSFLKKICMRFLEAKKRNDNIGGDDVASVEEAEMR